MLEQLRKASLGFYIFALICFVMPFITVSCQGEKIMSVSGVQLVTGFEVEQPSFDGRRKTEKQSPAMAAVVAAICCIAGIGLAAKAGQRSVVRAVPGAIGVLCMIWLKLSIDSEITKGGPSPIQVSYSAGYWLALLGMLAGAGISGYAHKQIESNPADSPPEASQ